MLEALKMFNHQVNFSKVARLGSMVFQFNEQQAGFKECMSTEEKMWLKCWSCQWSITFIKTCRYTNRVPRAFIVSFISTITFFVGAGKASNMVSQIASYCWSRVSLNNLCNYYLTMKHLNVLSWFIFLIGILALILCLRFLIDWKNWCEWLGKLGKNDSKVLKL